MNGCFFFAKLIVQVGGNRDKVISWGLNYLWLYFFKPSISKKEFSLRERLTYSFPRDRDTYLWKIINSIKRTKTPDVSCSNISQCEFSYNTFLLTIDFSFFFQFRLWAFIFFNCTFVCIRGDFPSQDGRNSRQLHSDGCPFKGRVGCGSKMAQSAAKVRDQQKLSKFRFMLLKRPKWRWVVPLMLSS